MSWCADFECRVYVGLPPSSRCSSGSPTWCAHHPVDFIWALTGAHGVDSRWKSTECPSRPALVSSPSLQRVGLISCLPAPLALDRLRPLVAHAQRRDRPVPCGPRRPPDDTHAADTEEPPDLAGCWLAVVAQCRYGIKCVYNQPNLCRASHTAAGAPTTR